MNTLTLPARSPEQAPPPEACFELDMPLHAYTDSDTHVAQLVGTLLNDIADVGHEVSHADVLQALAITTAVRVALADAIVKTGAEFSLDLLDVDVLTIDEAVEPAS